MDGSPLHLVYYVTAFPAFHPLPLPVPVPLPVPFRSVPFLPIFSRYWKMAKARERNTGYGC